MLDKDTQTQKASGSALAVQSGRDTYVGMQYSEVKDLFELLLERNFPKLRQEAIDESKLYVDKFAKELFGKISSSKESIDVEEKFKKPGVQASINDGVMYVARKTENADIGVVSDLILLKLDSEEDSLKGIIVDESIAMLPRVNSNLIKMFALSFYLRRLGPISVLSNEEVLRGFYQNNLVNFFPLESVERADLNHVEYINAVRSDKHYTTEIYKIINPRTGLNINSEDYKKDFEEGGLFPDRFPYLTRLLQAYGFKNLSDFDQLVLSRVSEYLGLSYLRSQGLSLEDPF